MSEWKAFGDWRLAFGVRRSAFGVRRFIGPHGSYESPRSHQSGASHAQSADAKRLAILVVTVVI
jgi:hypothetical protein